MEIGDEIREWLCKLFPSSRLLTNLLHLKNPVQLDNREIFSKVAITHPEMRQKLFTQGWQVAGTSAEGLANRIKSDTHLLGGVIAMRGIKSE